MSKEKNLDWYMDYFDRHPGCSVRWDPAVLATFQQKETLRFLEMLCGDNGLDPATGENVRSRTGISKAIDTLRARLKAAGVSIFK